MGVILSWNQPLDHWGIPIVSLLRSWLWARPWGWWPALWPLRRRSSLGCDCLKGGPWWKDVGLMGIATMKHDETCGFDIRIYMIWFYLIDFWEIFGDFMIEVVDLNHRTCGDLTRKTCGFSQPIWHMTFIGLAEGNIYRPHHTYTHTHTPILIDFIWVLGKAFCFGMKSQILWRHLLICFDW